jgi:SAM-dependent methyltransferase
MSSQPAAPQSPAAPQPPADAAPQFDAYADDYAAALNEGLSATGEGPEYFARGRIAWVRRLLDARGVRPAAVLDFGCGTGTATPFLLDVLGAERVVGIDVSARSLDVARARHGSDRATFATPDERPPDGAIDVAYCNGVFHHIPVARRSAAVAYVRDSLRTGGLFAFWENNPWNPGTRLVMSRCPFDRDAVTLSPPRARRLLRDGGFEVVKTNYLFLFPRMLAALRPIERLFTRTPIGAQYLVLCRKRD